MNLFPERQEREIDVFIREIMTREPGSRPLDEIENTFDVAIDKAREDGLVIVYGTFGYGHSIEPLGCVARLSPKYQAFGCPLFVACDVLGWNHDQAWAFIAGYDTTPFDPDKCIDPRARKHPDIVQFGKHIREKHAPGLRSQTFAPEEKKS
jgi:hypothetical protein